MRIAEPINKSGYFWLHISPDSKLPGTLVITDGGNIELEVVGLFDSSVENMFNNSPEHNEFKRIVGHVEEYGLVTLEDCFYKTRNISFNGISKSRLHVNRAFVGVAYDEDEDILYDAFKFSIEGIDDWVAISGIKVDYQFDKRTASINYLPPEEISLNLSNGMKLLVTFSWTLPSSNNTSEAKIAQKTYLKLVSEQVRPVDEFISAAHKITNLLGFAIDKTVCLDHITATSSGITRDIGEGKTIPVPISLYYPSLPYTDIAAKIEWHKMLFRFPQIREDAQRIINNWFDAYEVIEPALNLYFSTKTGGHRFLDSKFLSLAQGLETYHRRTSDEKVMDEIAFKELVEHLIKQCPDEHKTWLSNRVAYGNEVGLSRRIKSIIEPFKNIIGSSKVRGKLVRTVVATRNYLTHYDKSLESDAAKGKDLVEITLKLEAIYQLHLLQVLGFTQEEIQSIIDNSQEIKYKLG